MNKYNDTGDWYKDRHDRLLEWTEDAEAVNWLENYMSALEFYDDLIDKDKKIHEARVISNIYNALLYMPSNPFWLKHYHILGPQILLGMRSCSLANKLEKRKEGDDLIWSYVLRQVVDITLTVVELTRGRDIADLLELDIHDWALNHPNRKMESFDEYKREHTG